MRPELVDHHRLDRDLGLFVTHPLVGAGLPMWLPDGAAARHAVEEFVRELERREGYQHVHTPPLAKRRTYEISGHLDNFADDMFPPMAVSADDQLMLRPGLCPHHALVFASRGRSYRELPLRIAELGGQYRAERSGVLAGLSRVRGMWLNDAHIFCAPDQIGSEVAAVLGLVRRAHAALGVRPVGMRLSLRGEGGKYAGNDGMWQRAEAALRSCLEAADVPYVEAPGEAAFYGPEIDIQVADAAGREETLSTIQLDFLQPERFGLSYVDGDGERRRPVMVHRSLVGSMERLFGYLIDLFQGAFPVWYAPVQVVVLPVGAAQAAVAAEFADRAVRAGLRARVEVDGSLASRVRDAVLAGIPYAAVIGAREAADGRVSLRLRDGRALDPMPVDAALDLIGDVVASRSLDLLP